MKTESGRTKFLQRAVSRCEAILHEGGVVIVHCQRGCHRTGMFIAAIKARVVNIVVVCSQLACRCSEVAFGLDDVDDDVGDGGDACNDCHFEGGGDIVDDVGAGSASRRRD